MAHTKTLHVLLLQNGKRMMFSFLELRRYLPSLHMQIRTAKRALLHHFYSFCTREIRRCRIFPMYWFAKTYSVFGTPPLDVCCEVVEGNRTCYVVGCSLQK